MSDWISVNDELPVCNYESDDPEVMVSDAVLILDKDNYPSIGFGHINDAGVWTTYDGQHDFMIVINVTHWQPLPEPPK